MAELLYNEENYRPVLTKDFKEEEIEALLSILINYKDEYDQKLIEIYNLDYIMNLIDREKMK